MNNLSDFLLYSVPTCVIAFDPKMEIVYSNKQARYFLNRYELPDEITTLVRRIFGAIKESRLNELFPGEILLTKKFEGSPSNWRFSFLIRSSHESLVVVFVVEEKISNKLDLNEIRKQYRLTRKQTDILRRVMDGLKNGEISEELGITEQTVKDHLTTVYEKIGVEDRMSLMRTFMYTP